MFESLFQSFDEPADRTRGAARLAALRAELATQKLDGFVVPRADRHQGEYVPPCDERLAWLTGFSGSAGLAIVLKDVAAIFVDGRYTIAVRDQVDISVITPVAIAEERPEAWLRRHLGTGRLGYDPWLFAVARPVVRLLTPGPEVTMATPALPVSLPMPPAMNAAFCSWRQTTVWICDCASASKTRSIFAPGIPNT